MQSNRVTHKQGMWSFKRRQPSSSLDAATQNTNGSLASQANPGFVRAWYPLEMLRSTDSGTAFRPSRQKGQSFLKDRAVVSRIVSAIKVAPEDTLLEIGAGSGEMTLPLAQSRPARIIAIEQETVLAERLRRALAAENSVAWDVIEGDFLSLELSTLLAEHSGQSIRVVGNLPYSAASPILLKLLAERRSFIDLTLMFQLEVAERLVAQPATKAYGFLSVMTQQATRPKILFHIPPDAFRPRPKVYSALVRLDPRGKDELLVKEPEVFEAIVKSLLAHRRKNISNNIKYLKSSVLDQDTLRSGLEHLEIEPSRRAETLTVDQFAALAEFCTSRQ